MMLVETKILPSDIHGFGIFADQFIPKGTIVWRSTPGIDIKISRERIQKLPILNRKYVEVYAYLSKTSSLYILPADNGRYFDHSDNPNCISRYVYGEGEAVTLAIKDIHIGEEMTDDYRSFEKDANTLLFPEWQPITYDDTHRISHQNSFPFGMYRPGT